MNTNGNKTPAMFIPIHTNYYYQLAMFLHSSLYNTISQAPNMFAIVHDL